MHGRPPGVPEGTVTNDSEYCTHEKARAALTISVAHPVFQLATSIGHRRYRVRRRSHYHSPDGHHTGIRYLAILRSDGNLKDVRIYTGALTDEEITGLATAPEPGTLGLIGAALAAVGLTRRKRR